jgi:RNA 2',3'-cyclic 3'-phosphodiesterase
MAADELMDDREVAARPSGDEGRESPPSSAQRTFLAVPISDRLRNLLRNELAGEALPGRRVPAENWHITLRFLGSTPAAGAAALVEALRNRPLGAPFSLAFGALGAFPRPARASVLWMGIDEGADALAEIAARIEEITRQVGFPPADHPFRAHLTLSRLSPPANVRSFLERDLRPRESMEVGEVVLYRSHVGRGPAAYEVLDRIPLTG